MITTLEALQALAELVDIKDLQDEYLRRKQRRLHWLQHDPEEVAAVAEIKAECDRRRGPAWARAREIMKQTSLDPRDHT